jgi:bifunctional DNA-binding transcriptional regulator/antitoxin component of YhaV-PrlF toxin-antitoxin module
MLKKRFLLSLALKNKIFYKIYLYYNLYIRNFKYIFQKSYSQFNDDIFIKKFFQEKAAGTYVDIGCHHPFKLNNTYLLYKKGWEGLNIDLMKINIDLFNIWRPRDKNICSAVSNKNKISWVYIPNNNILSTEISIQKSYANTIKRHHKNPFIKKKFLVLTFENIIKNYKINLKKFDFLKIDIEGEDYKVLKNINLKKYNPTLICIEDGIEKKENKNKITKYLKSKKYELIFRSPINLFYQKLDKKNKA